MNRIDTLKADLNDFISIKEYNNLAYGIVNRLEIGIANNDIIAIKKCLEQLIEFINNDMDEIEKDQYKTFYHNLETHLGNL